MSSETLGHAHGDHADAPAHDAPSHDAHAAPAHAAPAHAAPAHAAPAHAPAETHGDHGDHGEHGHAHAPVADHGAPPPGAHPEPGAHGDPHGAAHAPAGDHGGHGEHGDHGADPTLHRDAGLTMACMGVLLALCAALVGAKRTDLLASMVDQTNTASQYHAVTAKHRVLAAQLLQLHARMPDPKELAKADEELKRLDDANPRGSAGQFALRTVELGTRNILDSVTPSQMDLDRFAWLIMKFSDQKEAAKEWAESFDATIEAHRLGAEHYEWGQIFAELGIVIASIALLFKSRKVWVLSVLVGLAGVAIVTATWLDVSTRLHHAERKTVEANRRYLALSSEAADARADEELLDEIEKGN